MIVNENMSPPSPIHSHSDFNGMLARSICKKFNGADKTPLFRRKILNVILIVLRNRSIRMKDGQIGTVPVCQWVWRWFGGSTSDN